MIAPRMRGPAASAGREVAQRLLGRARARARPAAGGAASSRGTPASRSSHDRAPSARGAADDSPRPARDAALADQRRRVLGRRVALRCATTPSGSRNAGQAVRAQVVEGLRRRPGSCGRRRDPGGRGGTSSCRRRSPAPRARSALIDVNVSSISKAVPASPPRFMLPTSTRPSRKPLPVFRRSRWLRISSSSSMSGVAMMPSRSGSSSTRRARARY